MEAERRGSRCRFWKLDSSRLPVRVVDFWSSSPLLRFRHPLQNAGVSQIFFYLENIDPNLLVTGTTATLANQGVAHTLPTNLTGSSTFVMA